MSTNWLARYTALSPSLLYRHLHRATHLSDDGGDDDNDDDEEEKEEQEEEDEDDEYRKRPSMQFTDS